MKKSEKGGFTPVFRWGTAFLSPALQRLRGTNTPDSHTTSMRCHSATMALTDNTVAVIELLETKEDFTYVLVEYTEGLTTRGQPPYEVILKDFRQDEFST